MLWLGGNGEKPQVFRYLFLSIPFTSSNYIDYERIRIVKSLLQKVQHLVVVHLVPEWGKSRALPAQSIFRYVKKLLSQHNTDSYALTTLAVELQVQVPTSGSETVECGVCQHAFLVSANWYTGETVHAIEIVLLITIPFLLCCIHNKCVFCQPVHVSLIVLVITVRICFPFPLYMDEFQFGSIAMLDVCREYH
jgi:hypothetical protein